MSPRKRTQPPSERTKLKNVALFTDQDQVEVQSVAAPTLPLKKIIISQQQPRCYFDPDKLEQLTISVKEHGILEPLLVRPLKDGNYELVAGERRFRAATAASLKEVPVVIKELNDKQALQLALIENLQREDLNPVEETEGILQLLTLKLESTQQEVISLLDRLINTKRGFTDNVVSNEKQQLIEEVFATIGTLSFESFRTHRIPLLKLPEDILEPLRQGKIEYTKAKAIAKIKEESARKELMAEAMAKSLSLREIKERIKAATPQPQKEEIFNRLDNAYKQVKKSKKLIRENSRKLKKIESLLAQLQKLFEQPS